MARKWTNSKGQNIDADRRVDRELGQLRRELIKRPNNNNKRNYNNKRK